MAASENNDQANSALAEILNILSQSQTILSDLSARREKVLEHLNALESQSADAQSIVNKLDQFRADSEAKNNSIDTNLLATSQKIQDFNKISEKLDILANELQNKQSAIDTKISEIDYSINQLRVDTTNLRENIAAELPNFRLRVETEQASLRQGIETEQSSLRKSIEVEQSSLRQKLEEISTSFQTKHTELTETRSKEFSEKINELQQQTIQRIAEEVKASEVIISTLEKYEEQAKQVLGTVVITSQAGVYKSDALEEGRAKKFFRGWASTFMIFAVVILVGPSVFELFMKGALNVNIDWHDWLARLPISLVLLIPAFYFARESTRHSNNERKSKRRELILSTIDPYLELLEPAGRDGLKLKLAEKIFDPTDSETISQDDEVKGIIPHLTSLISAIKGGK
jgi:hypothetical protein